MANMAGMAGRVVPPAQAPPEHTTGAAARATTQHVIRPADRWPGIDLPELWRYRGLFLFLVWRDIKVRYAQTVLGAGWAIVQPVFTMVVFTVIFGNLASLPSDGVPYAAFSLTALVPWTYFSVALGGASNSLVGSSNLLTKVYFPRLVVPLSALLVGLVDFTIAFAILLGVLLAFGIVPAAASLFVLPVLMLCMIACAAGAGCLLAALNVRYRDVRAITGFLVQVWLYASPVVYPMSMVPDRYRLVYALNPMAGVIEGFRAVLLRTQPVPWDVVGISCGASILMFAAGVVYFRRVESSFADVA
jgi:lipopolysaccharide transport system permease protein